MIPTKARAVRFLSNGQDAPLLEGELWLPESTPPVAGVVVAHPHPQRGGSMDNNVVVAVCEGLTRAGIAALRFNFRGVGQSEGTSSAGSEEPGDLLGALAFLAAQAEIDAQQIGLAGYSFGARMCFAVVPRAPQLKALLAIAAPLREPLPAAEHPVCPFLALVGDRDGLVAQGVERYASYLPHPARLQIVAGPDHFWWGFEPTLIAATETFFATHLT